jgi:hypothetical protein
VQTEVGMEFIKGIMGLGMPELPFMLEEPLVTM